MALEGFDSHLNLKQNYRFWKTQHNIGLSWYERFKNFVWTVHSDTKDLSSKKEFCITSSQPFKHENGNGNKHEYKMYWHTVSIIAKKFFPFGLYREI